MHSNITIMKSASDILAMITHLFLLSGKIYQGLSYPMYPFLSLKALAKGNLAVISKRLSNHIQVSFLDHS